MSVKEGDTVKKGDLLAEIDARPYKAKLELARAQLAVSTAQMKLAVANLERAKVAFEKGAGSKHDLSQAEAGREVAAAEIEAAKATVAIAELDVSYTKLISPIDGRVGRFVTTPGNLVKADETMIVSVTSESTVTVSFDVDERTILATTRAMGANGGKTSVEIGLSDEAGVSHKAALGPTSCEVDPKTGTIRMRAMLANPNGLIVRGSFLYVRLTVPPGK